MGKRLDFMRARHMDLDGVESEAGRGPGLGMRKAQALHD